MQEGYCSHLRNLELGEFKSLLNKTSTITLSCSDCNKTNGDEIKDVETSEVVYICLNCLHIGCVGESKGHAKSHFKELPSHMLCTKPNGELYCYECEMTVTNFEPQEKAKVAEFQKILREFLEKQSNDKSPVIMEEIKGISSGLKSIGSTNIDKKNAELYETLISRAA